MSQQEVLEAGRTMLVITLQLCLPLLLFGLVAGVLVSLFQTVTQIQEYTLTFVPKLFAVVLALALFGPWMLTSLVRFMNYAFNHFPR